MGHTVMSQRIASDIMMSELKDYGKALPEKDRIIYEGMIKKAMKHYGAISFADSINSWAFFLLSIMLEQEKEMHEKTIQ